MTLQTEKPDPHGNANQARRINPYKRIDSPRSCADTTRHVKANLAAWERRKSAYRNTELAVAIGFVAIVVGTICACLAVWGHA
jgi:hypothetical protein